MIPRYKRLMMKWKNYRSNMKKIKRKIKSIRKLHLLYIFISKKDLRSSKGNT